MPIYAWWVFITGFEAELMEHPATVQALQILENNDTVKSVLPNLYYYQDFISQYDIKMGHWYLPPSMKKKYPKFRVINDPDYKEFTFTIWSSANGKHKTGYCTMMLSLKPGVNKRKQKELSKAENWNTDQIILGFDRIEAGVRTIQKFSVYKRPDL